MSNDSKIATQGTPAGSDINTVSSALNTYNFHQSGEGTNIGVAQNVTSNTVNVYLPGSGGSMQPGSPQKQILNLDYYSLFVIVGERYEGSYFIMDTDRALTVKYGTAHNIHNRLAIFDDAAIAEIKTYPAIFATENCRYSPPENPTVGEQFALYGVVTDVKPMQNGKIKVYFQKFPMCYIPQELLNQMIVELDIQGHYKLNELDKTHWSIKNVKLTEELKLKGVSLLVPTI